MGLQGLWIGLATGIYFCGLATAYLLLRVDWDATVSVVRKKLGLSNISLDDDYDALDNGGDGGSPRLAKNYGTLAAGN